MVSIGQQHLIAKLPYLVGDKGFYCSLAAHRHKDRGLDVAMGGGKQPGAGAAIPFVEFEYAVYGILLDQGILRLS